ncbi:MATE family efflux transporter [Fusibacter tunisiensis]|uniref:Probable multidrug resistance protein NorM n=1 Tax=Fusibacter tunisiensis TaxID=1008308 RepID=A0ABS2MQV2_9FIRM|nr:MATE family efflux transporter [Fusibacter tunisiensis]MBM7561747.1 putative MATE family efflux protein [Fusibacter tunisiensis]
MSRLIFSREVRKIWKLAWPVMVGQLLHTLMVTADMWFISQIGSTEAAAAGSASSLIGVIQVMPFLISAGTIALVARYTGAEEPEEIQNITGSGLIVSLISGIIFMTLSYMNMTGLLGIFGEADGLVLSLARDYVWVALMGLPFFFINSTARAVVQATGDTKNPVKVFIFANVLNIGLDYVFIMVLGYGIKGAAAATVISEITASVWMLALVGTHVYNRHLTAILNSLKLNVDWIKRILKIGRYAALHQITRPFTGLIMFRIVLEISVDAGAAFGIGGRMFNFVFIFLAGLGTAMSVMVGQALGRQDLDEVDRLIRHGIGLALINMIVFAIPFYLVPEWIMGFFVKDPSVISIGANYLRITYTGVIFAAFLTVHGSAFSGAGDTFPPMLASIIGNWGVKIPLAFLLTRHFNWGANGVWFAISISVIVEAFIVALWFKKGQWKYRNV